MKKKLVLLLSVVLVMCGLLCACGNDSSKTYVEIDGERYDMAEFADMLTGNDLKQEQFVGKSVTVVGRAYDIQGPKKVNGIPWNTSCSIGSNKERSGFYTAIMQDDSYDDVLANLPQENLVKIQGTLSVDFIEIHINNATVEVLE